MKTLFTGIALLFLLLVPQQGKAGNLEKNGTCSIYDPVQGKFVQAQWSGPCRAGKAEGTGTAKWLAPSQMLRGGKFPFQYDGDIQQGKFQGRGRLIRENIAMTGNFSNGNIEKNGKFIGQMLPTLALLNGDMTLDQALAATESQVMEFNCVNGKCSNSAYLSRIQQENLLGDLFGAAVAAYVLKEGLVHIAQAFLDSAPSSQIPSAAGSKNHSGSRCSNPELGAHDNGYTVWCDSNDGGLMRRILGEVYKWDDGWTYLCLKGQTHYCHVGTAHQAMMAAVGDCRL